MNIEDNAQPGDDTPVLEAQDQNEGVENAPQGEQNGAEEAAGAAPNEQAEQADKKSPVHKLQGRIGHLTRQAHEREAKFAEELEALRRRAEAAEKLLQTGEEAPAAKADTARAPEDLDALVTKRAQEIAEAQAFNAECNRIYDEGEKQFPDWKDSVSSLQSMGLLQRDLVEAAAATGDPAKVLHALGSDLDEAERIAGLKPAAMGAALAKLAVNLSQKTPISKAPPPIKPVGGAAKTEVDIYDPDMSDEAYWAARKKQGASYIR